MANRERRRIQIFRAGAASNSTDCTAYDRYVELRTFVPLSGRPKLNRSRARRRLHRTRLQSFDIALDFSRWRVNLARTLCLKNGRKESLCTVQVPHRAMPQTYFVPVSYGLRLYLSSLGLGDRPEQPPWRLLAQRDEPKLTSTPLTIGPELFWSIRRARKIPRRTGRRLDKWRECLHSSQGYETERV